MDLTIFEILTKKDYYDEVMMIRRIGIAQIGSDYSKYALGFFQLSSMSELAIVIRFSVHHMIKRADFDFDTDSEDSILE